MELDEETNTLVQQALNDILDTQNIQNWGSLSYERIRNSGYPVRYKLYYKENDFFPLIIRLEDFVVNITPPEVVTQQPQRILFKVGEEGIFRTSYKINQGEEFVVEIGETNSDGKVAIGKIRRPTNLPINILRKSIINYPECYELAKAATKPAPWPVIQILTGIFTPEDISIDEKTSIIKLTLPDIIEIESHLGTGFESGKPLLHNRITHIVGLKVSGLNEINYFQTEIEIFQNILTALRLYKPGRVELGFFLGFDETGKLFIQLSEDPTQYRENDNTDITQIDNTDNFLKFWIKFLGLQKVLNTHLEIAIERFMSSFTHKILKSQLLDLVIGIESIFSENAESISYKYSLRGSLAIGKTKEERLIVRNELKLAYAIRSNLAHGSNDSLQKEAKTIVNDDAKLYSFVTNLRQTLSKAIINKATWIKNNGKSGKEFLNFLDEAMVAKGLDETFYQS